MSIQDNTRRKTYLDCLRIIAAFFVILHHTPALELFQQEIGIKTWCYASMSSFTMLNTPIFFMISGALLLSREESLRYVLRHRAVRFIVVIFLINYAMYWAYGYPSMGLGRFDFFFRALRGIIDGKYWYLYAYLAFLLMLPFLQKAVRGMTWGHFWLLITLRFLLYTAFPVLNYFLPDTVIVSIHGSFDVAFAADRWIFFPVIGYFVDRSINMDNMKPWHVLILLAAGVLGIVSTNLMMFYESTVTGFSVNFIQIFDYLTAICVFVFIKYVFCHYQNWWSRHPGICNTISFAGKLTFGIYLLDPVMQALFFEDFLARLNIHIPLVFVCIIWAICSMSVNGMITYFLKKIPVVGKLF